MPTERVLIEIVTAANLAGVKQAKAGFLGMTPATLGLAAALGVVVYVGKAAIENYKAQEEANLSLTQAVEANNAEVGKSSTIHRDVSKQIAANTAAQRHLAEVEAGMPTKHAATTLQLMHLQDAQKKAADTARALAAAQKPVIDRATNQTIVFAQLRADLESFLTTNKRFIANQYDTETALGAIVRAGNNEKDAMRLLNDALDLSAIKHEDVTAAAKSLVLVEAGNGRVAARRRCKSWAAGCLSRPS